MREAESTPVPQPAKLLGTIVNPLYRLFDWLCYSKYNPLYRSGTLAVGFLFILLVTGLYLSFFYSVSGPYESVARLQQQIWLGRWIRSLHRYATVAAVISISFHILQLLVQGKSWGPRTLAWLSGVIMLGMFLISAWSGYVMVWDQHGQLVALAGAKFLQIFPFLSDMLADSFNGASLIPAGFFFMNLFLHVALPLCLIIFLWIHTAKLSRAVWFPTRPILISSTLALFALSVLFPAPLLEKAELLRRIGRIPIDLSSGFWIPMIDTIGVAPTWVVIFLIFVALFTIPWWWKPSLTMQRPISAVDAEKCTGCTQCALDCPYEAITMVPREDGRRLIAEVNSRNCVSCGICAASCGDFAIGPPGRTAIDQRVRVGEYVDGLRSLPEKSLVTMVACTNNRRLCDLLSEYAREHPSVALYPVECCGCVHSEVIETILAQSEGLALIGCPARNCFNRDGLDLLTGRIYEKRVPFVDRSIDRSRIAVSAYSEAESWQVIPMLDHFVGSFINRSQPAKGNTGVWLGRFRAVLTTVVLLAIVAGLSQFPIGTPSSRGTIRFAARLPSASSEKCRVPTDEELRGIPLHMRQKEICEKIPLLYRINVSMNSKQLVDEKFGSLDQRIDRPLSVNIDRDVDTGNGMLTAKITILEREREVGSYSCEKEVDLPAGEIHLLKYLRDEGRLDC